MKNQGSEFKFPRNINLANQPLIEAWLDIKWSLKESPQISGSFVDPDFPFALGVFFEKVKERFPNREDLPLSTAPAEVLPHNVRYKFSAIENSPLLQLGPGVATVNFTDDYNWQAFEKESLYLRAKLTESYSNNLQIKNITLRYRNAVKIDFVAENVFDFLRTRLNTNISFPKSIPGSSIDEPGPASWQSVLTYNLKEPIGKGTVRFATAYEESNNSTMKTPVLVFDIEILSQDQEAPDILSESDFKKWMENAHAIAHEWFFSLIDGELRREYEETKEAIDG